MKKPLIARLRTWINPFFREILIQYYRLVWKMDIGKGARISYSAKLDKTNPRGIHIGDETAITFDVVLLTHDHINGVHRDVWIGRQCFIGARTIVYPGVRIGDNCIVSAASVVMKDVPSNSFVAGNPARVLETNVHTTQWGRRVKSFQE